MIVYPTLYLTVLVRLAVAWLGLSLMLGAATFYLEMKRADSLMLDLALMEAGSFTDHMDRGDLTHLDVLRQKAEDFVQLEFISVRVYDASRRKILETVKQGRDEARLGIEPHVHAFALREPVHYHTYWVGRQPYMQLLLPLEVGGSLLGYFEGVHEVDAATVKTIEAGIIRTLTLVVIVILTTSVALYPIIILLNRGLSRISGELLKSNVELMEVLGSAIAKRDSDTHLHNYRVTIYAIRLAESLGLSRRNIQRLIAGAFLHDVGKIGVSDHLLLKAAPLNAAELGEMRAHVSIGIDIIGKAGWLESARDVVEFHHEKFDGSGYPRGLKGDAIPLNARLFAIVDVFDALLSTRPYKDALRIDEVRAIMRRLSGSRFDPKLFSAFARIEPTLHSEVGDVDIARLHETLQALLDKYFPVSGNFERLQGRRPGARATTTLAAH